MKSPGGTCKCRQNVQLLRVKKNPFITMKIRLVAKAIYFSGHPGGLVV